MEKNDLAMIKAENDRLVSDIEKLKQRLREEITRTQAGVRLDLNLEKGRLRDESSGQELKIKEVDTRIEQEIAGLRMAIQSSKVIIQWTIYVFGVNSFVKATTLQYLVGFGIVYYSCQPNLCNDVLYPSDRLFSPADGILKVPCLTRGIRIQLLSLRQRVSLWQLSLAHTNQSILTILVQPSNYCVVLMLEFFSGLVNGVVVPWSPET
jgi:hypothetical protein